MKTFLCKCLAYAINQTTIFFTYEWFWFGIPESYAINRIMRLTQSCGAGAQAILDGWSQRRSWSQKFFRYWSRSLKYGFRLKQVIQIKPCFFSIFWRKLFSSQKSQDVRAGARKIRCPELEPESET